MLRTLLESNAPRPQRRASTVASIAIHTAVIGAAVVATAAAKTDSRPPSVGPRDTVIYVEPRPTPRPAIQRAYRRAGRGSVPLPPSAPVLRFEPPLPPTAGVEIDVARMLMGDGRLDDPSVDPIGPPGPNAPGPMGTEAATASTVDRPAEMRSAPRPRYPEQLRAAGVAGRVVVRLVVDTTGRIEPASVVVRESSHDLFEAAVRAVLPSLRFAPAEAGGRRVRMLVELPFEFRLNDR